LLENLPKEKPEKADKNVSKILYFEDNSIISPKLSPKSSVFLKKSEKKAYFFFKE